MNPGNRSCDRRRGWIGAALGAAAVALGHAAACEPPPILLADDAHPPRVTVSWTVRGGETTTLSGERKYQSPGEKTRLGANIDCYVALGGVRLDKAAADPDGAVIRVGLYKADAKKPFFEGLADDAVVTIRLDGVRLNQGAVARPKTGLMHLRYMLDDLTTCGISADGRNQYLTASKDDKAIGTVLPESARPGVLDGEGKGHGSITTETASDGSSTVTFKFPYALLRHQKDPSQRTTPGAFFEPQHFHCEVEFLPTEVAAARDGTKAPSASGPAGPTAPSSR